MRQAVSPRARVVAAAVALAVTLATWMPWLALGLGLDLHAWSALVFDSCRPFCHQLADRSFGLFQHTLPLCARCTGMWLGITLGVVLAMAWRPRHRHISGVSVALLATALSEVDHLRELHTGVGWPWVRFSLGFAIFLGVTLAISFDLLALLLAACRRLMPRLQRTAARSQ